MIALLVAVNQYSLKILPTFEPIRNKTNRPFFADDTYCLSSFDESTELLAFEVTSFDFCFGSFPTL